MHGDGKPPEGKRWKKGQSGNPGGRKKEDPEMRELARSFTKEAIERLAFWMRSTNSKASVSACSVLLDRGHGKPAQAVEHSGSIAMSHEEALAALDHLNDDTEGNSASASTSI